MKGIFVRALFGDDVVERRGKVLEDIERILQEPLQPEPLVTYAYGIQNYDWLRSHGVDAILASEHAIIDWDKLGRRDPGYNGQIGYTYSLWRMKLDAMERALSLADQIVWLDADAHLQKPIDAAFWSRLEKGQPIQMPLVSYKTKTCKWRGRHETRSVPEGALIYLRSRAVLERAKEVYAVPGHQWWTDQTVFAYVMDEMVGKLEPGLFTPEGYKEDGFQFPFCTIYNPFFEPEVEYFVVSRGPPLARWQRRQQRMEAAK